MPFKIVQTKENNQFLLTIVPQKWEKNGELMWPPDKKSGNEKNEASKPQSNWTKMLCRLKRRNIKTYGDAEKIIVQMRQSYDTTDDDGTNRIKSKIKRRMEIGRSPQKVFAQPTLEYVQTTSSISIPKIVPSPVSIENDKIIEVEFPATQYLDENIRHVILEGDRFIKEIVVSQPLTHEVSNTELNSSYPKNEPSQSKLEQQLDALITKVDEMVSVQAAINVKLDVLLANHTMQPVLSAKYTNVLEIDKSKYLPVSNEEMAETLNKNLANKDFMTAMVIFFSFLFQQYLIWLTIYVTCIRFQNWPVFVEKVVGWMEKNVHTC